MENDKSRAGDANMTVSTFQFAQLMEAIQASHVTAIGGITVEYVVTLYSLGCHCFKINHVWYY